MHACMHVCLTECLSLVVCVCLLCVELHYCSAFFDHLLTSLCILQDKVGVGEGGTEGVANLCQCQMRLTVRMTMMLEQLHRSGQPLTGTCLPMTPTSKPTHGCLSTRGRQAFLWTRAILSLWTTSSSSSQIQYFLLWQPSRICTWNR